MSSQSPRIYTYKITFEEVPYYYYGVHKEKRYNEYYMGSPKTHKWCWELYTPKKQILEIFEFSDDGWLKSQKVEKSLIKPFYTTDRWCLNESCGGNISLCVSRKTIQKNKKNKVGIFGLSKKQLSEYAKISGINHRENKTGFFSLTPEERTEVSKRVGIENYEKGIGIHKISKEERREIVAKLNSQKWMCLETGYITTSGPLTSYQKARGIDTTKRKRIS